MIGVVRKDGGGAPELLGKHRPGEKVGPGRPTEREEEVGRGAFRPAEAVGAADQEARLPTPFVSPALEPPGEFEATESLAFFVEEDGYSGLGRRRELAAAFGEFGNPGRPGNALQVAFDQLGLG